MGLDWNPIGRPKSGHETEFAQLFNLIQELADKVGWLERVLLRIRGIKPDQIKRRWFEIQISPFETLQAPQVGRSPEATAWAKERYLKLKEPKPSEAEFLREMEGYYVAALAPPCDGLPVYSNGPAGYVELYSFRAQFLNDCMDIIGEKLHEKCYHGCSASGLTALASELRKSAVSYSTKAGVAHVEHIRSPNEFDEGSPESKAHILFSAAKWCEYWSSRGHGLEAYW